MYLSVADAVRWAEQVAVVVGKHPVVEQQGVELFVLPSLPAVPPVLTALAGTPFRVGAQDLFWEDRGAFTGGVSGADLRAIGCTLVEVGHMERRRHFGEDQQTVRRKLAAAFRNELTPVLCVGERRDRGTESALSYCLAQLESALVGMDVPARPLPARAAMIVAYEPEWAIGGALAADPDRIDAVSRGIHQTLESHPWLSSTDVIYGGSAQPGLLPRLGSDVDGLFLGRFAHDPAAIGRLLDELLPLV